MPVKAHQASDYLKTPEDVAAYLNAAIEEMGEDPRLLMKALRKRRRSARRRVSAGAARQARSGRVVSCPVWSAPSSAGHAHQSGRRMRRQAPVLGVIPLCGRSFLHGRRDQNEQIIFFQTV